MVVTAGLVAAGVGAGVNYFGQKGQAEANAKQAEQQRKMEMDMFNARRGAYNDLINRGRGDMQAGETAFLNEANTQLPELQTMQNDMLSGNAAALNQGSAAMRANLATQGVRGGQAATLMNRGAADMAVNAQRGMNEMAFNEAAQRASERRAYQSQKAHMGQSGSMAAPTF